MQNIGAIGHGQSLWNIVIGDEDANPRPAQIRDDLLNIDYGQWINPRKRFVEKNESRVQHQRTRDFQSPPLSPGEGISPALSYCFESHLCQQFFQTIALLLRL